MTTAPTFTFHVQHKARIEHIERILETATENQPLDVKALYASLLQAGYEITIDGVSRSLNLAMKLGILNRAGASSAYQLTERGLACRSLALYRRDVFWDVAHFLLFATWELGGHCDYWSWSYARVCEILWQTRPEIEDRKRIFGQLAAAAAKDFPELSPVVGTETVQFVTSCIKQLSPPFVTMENARIMGSQERPWFSVELALLAVSYLYVVRNAPIESPILLDPEVLEQICPLCLAPTDCIIAMLETASRTFPFLDIHLGEWGSSLILRKPIDIQTLV